MTVFVLKGIPISNNWANEAKVVYDEAFALTVIGSLISLRTTYKYIHPRPNLEAPK